MRPECLSLAEKESEQRQMLSCEEISQISFFSPRNRKKRITKQTTTEACQVIRVAQEE